MHKLRILAALMGIGVVILACGETSTAGQAVVGGNQALATHVTEPAKMGTTITVDGVDCTPVSVKPLADDGFDAPKAGDEFIVVHVKLYNHSGSEQSYNEFDFHVRSSSGDITDPQVPPSTYSANDELNTGNLTNGGRTEGDVILEAPKADRGAMLTWQPSFLGNAGDNDWLLGL
jgi:hypothetical protein